MIVVDKLQTGFDEPKLHTLFLDKEIRDINAIQTISRVNRTTKYKEDCHIIDLSHNNVNINNIQMLLTYCDMAISDMEPLPLKLLSRKLLSRFAEKHYIKSGLQNIKHRLAARKAIRILCLK